MVRARFIFCGVGLSVLDMYMMMEVELLFSLNDDALVWSMQCHGAEKIRRRADGGIYICSSFSRRRSGTSNSCRA